MRASLKPRSAPAEAILGPGGNSIGFLRFALAALVILHHAWVLSGHGDPLARRTDRETDFGILAVTGFFVLSGFLIARSADRARSFARFLWHRVLRIMPAFWVCLVVCAGVFGPWFWFVEHRSLVGYADVATDPPLGYVVNNLGLVVSQTRIDNVLADNPYGFGINGSLWTLPYEFAWYLITGVIGAFGLLRRRWLAMLVLGVLLAPQIVGLPQPLREVPVLGYALSSRFALAFGLGIAAYLWRDRLRLDDRAAALAAVVLVASVPTRTFAELGVPALAYLLLWTAWRLPVRRFDGRWDLSYGIYIYAFPVQQGLAQLGVASLPPPVVFVIGLAATLPFAFLSYVVIERPALRMKHANPFRRRRAPAPVAPTPVPGPVPAPADVAAG